MTAPIDPRRYLSNQILSGILPETFTPVLPLIHERECEPGALIFEEGDEGEELFLILEGSVKISKLGRAAQQETLAHLAAGDFFGDMALVDKGVRSAQARADSRTVLAVIDKSAWSGLLQIAPEIVLTNFTRAVTRRLRDNNQKFIEEMLRNERLSLLGATVSSIVHDMNNPIACILGACQLLQRELCNDTAEQMTDIILKSVERMEAMTQEMIDFARGTTNLSLQTVSTGDLVRDVEQQDLARCAEAGIQVRKDIRWEGNITLDVNRVLRLLGNLIKNAREAMSDGGTLGFGVDFRDEFVVFEVADTGCGIAPEMLPKIWEPFVTFGKKKGTGLGLAISKAVVDAHEGTITVRSTPGTGTVFEIRLPADRP